MARNTNAEPKQFTVVSCNHDNLAATMNQVWESGYSPWKILTAVDADGVRFFTIEATLDLDRYNEQDPLPQVRYVAQRCKEASLADALNKIHVMGYDPTKQWSHKNAEGQREFCVLGVLSESRFVDPKQTKIAFDKDDGKLDRGRGETLKVGKNGKVEPIEMARFRKATGLDVDEPIFDTPSRRKAKPKPEVPA